MFCPVCGNECAPVDTYLRSKTKELLATRHYCAPCDLFYIFRASTRTIEVALGPELEFQQAIVNAPPQPPKHKFQLIQGGKR